MPEPLRIGLLAHSVLPRGGVVHVLELADALTALGHRATVIAPVEPGQALFREVASQVVLLPMETPHGDFVGQVRQRIASLEAALPRVIAEGGYDLLHAHDSLNGNALAGLRARDRRLVPWVRTVHHLDDYTDPQLAAWQARAWRAADALGAVSETWCARLRELAGAPVERLWNGVNLDRFKAADAGGDAEALAAWGWRDERIRRPRCLAVGGVEARKNSVRLLEAFATLRRDVPGWADAQLVVAGGASLLDHGATLRAWHDALARLGWGEGPDHPVWRTGPVPDDVLPPLMRRADVVAMPSLVEGFGLVALEALACGTPVLVSRRAPFTEHLGDCPHVAWCDPEEPASIASGLQQALALRRPLAVPEVCWRHGWAASAERHADWYRRVLAERSDRISRPGALQVL